VFTVYVHLKKGSLKVKAGDSVKKGEEIGLVGNSGISYAPHLHFGVYDENRVSLPFKFTLNNPDNTLTRIEPKKDMIINN
jgi:murein DD-endopeptidase MepM/ murein hydrolase activator NlpD